MNFTDKRIWITGASSGIGEALTYLLSERGAEIIISSRRIEELERVKNKCKNKDKIHIQLLDLENHDQIIPTTKDVIDLFGKIDILINNGGISQRSLAKVTPPEVDKKIMDVNYFGTIYLTKALLPYMIDNKGGHIVVISSLTGKFGAPMRSAYSASKHALHGFFETLRAECQGDGIQVTLICPGYVKTNVSINALTAAGESQNTMDKSTENGMHPSKLAKKIVRSIERNRKELITGGPEILVVYIKRFFPGLFYWLVGKSLKIPDSEFKS